MSVDPRRPPQDWMFSLALCAVALLPRLFVAIAWAREPVWDGHYYHFGAERIAEGFGYSEDVVVHGVSVAKPWCHYPVGYSGMLAPFYAIFGAKLWVAPLFNVVVGVLTTLCAYRLALYGMSVTRARVAGALVALHPGLIAYTALVMTELTAGLLLLAAAWAGLRYRERIAGPLLAGALLGLATLVRPASILALPLLVLFAPLPLRRAVLRALLAGAVAIACVLPWTIRNCAVMDGCAFVSTNGGWNLAIGALSDSGRFESAGELRLKHERYRDACHVVTGQVQQDRCWASIGMTEIKRDPLRWIGLMPKKLGHTYDHESFAIEYVRIADTAAWPEERRVAGRQLLSTFHRLLLLIAALSVLGLPSFVPQERRQWLTQCALLLFLAGLAVYGFADIHHPFFWLPALTPLLAVLPLPGAPRHGRVLYYLFGLLALTSLTHAIFFGEDRYHVVVTPALCILAAAALRRPQKQTKRLPKPSVLPNLVH